eukprot:2539779-Pyramimonas_sp.AAC.1
MSPRAARRAPESTGWTCSPPSPPGRDQTASHPSCVMGAPPKRRPPRLFAEKRQRAARRAHPMASQRFLWAHA